MQPTIHKGDLVQVRRTMPLFGNETIKSGIIGIVTETAQSGSSQYVEFVDGNGQYYNLSSLDLKKI